MGPPNPSYKEMVGWAPINLSTLFVALFSTIRSKTLELHRQNRGPTFLDLVEPPAWQSGLNDQLRKLGLILWDQQDTKTWWI